MRAWIHNIVRRWLFKLFTYTESASGTVNGTSNVVMIDWGWSEPGTTPSGNSTPPLIVLRFRRASVIPKPPLEVLLSPAQAHQVCLHGATAVENQRRLFGDSEPREFNTGNVRGVM